MQSGLGKVLAGFASDLPERTLGLVVVTHSRPIVRELLALSPWCLRAGDDRRSTREWVDAPPADTSAEEFLALGETASARKRAIQAVLNARAEERLSESPGRRGPR